MWFFIGYVLICFFRPSENVFYRSASIQDLEFEPYGVDVIILDDQLDSTVVTSLIDQNGILYWHRKIFTPVCQTGECKEIDVGIYWKCSGEFMGLEVYKEHLTRTDHSIFSEDDYKKLIRVLMDDWSILREYEYDDLLTEPLEETENESTVDGVTGATRQEIADETVADAVFTTYTLWHLIHVGEKEQLRSASATLINESIDLLNRLIHAKDIQYSTLVLELFAEGKLSYSTQIKDLIFKAAVTGENSIQRELALKSFSKFNFEDPLIQDEVSLVYNELRANDKIRILNYMKTPDQLTKSMYDALISELDLAEEWLAGSTFKVIKRFKPQNSKVIELAEKLSESQNTFARQSAIDLLEDVDGNEKN